MKHKSKIIVGIIIFGTLLYAYSIWIKVADQPKDAGINSEVKLKNTEQFFKEATVLINSNEFKLKNIGRTRRSADNTDRLMLSFVSNTENIDYYYDFNSKQWADFKVGLNEFNFPYLTFPEIPDDMIKFGVEGAYNKTRENLNAVFNKNPQLNNFIIFTEYDKEKGWAWNVWLFGEGESNQNIAVRVTPENVEVITKINIIE